MALGEVLVLADQHDRVGPEAFGIATGLIRVVIRQSSADAFGLADVSKLPVLRIFIGADQDVRLAVLFRESLTDPAELIAPEGDRLDR